jgi:hypothetical protein
MLYRLSSKLCLYFSSYYFPPISFQLVAFQKHSLRKTVHAFVVCVSLPKMFGQQECVLHAALQLCVWAECKHSPCKSACEIHLSYIYSSYRAVNPLLFGYRNQYVHIPWESNHCKHLNILYGQNVEFVNVKHGGMYNKHRFSQHNNAPFSLQIFLVHVSVVNSHLQAVL